MDLVCERIKTRKQGRGEHGWEWAVSSLWPGRPGSPGERLGKAGGWGGNRDREEKQGRVGTQGGFPWVSSDRGQGEGRTEMWDQQPAPQNPVLAPRPNTNLLCDSGQTPFLPWACVSGVHRAWVRRGKTVPSATSC